MATSVTRHTESFSSGEIPTVDPDRAADVEQKHREIADFLAAHRYDALLLQRPANFAWFTSGGDSSRGGSSETTASLFITPEARVVVTNNTDSTQLFDCELPGLGFQLKERPWHEPRHGLVDDLCRGRMVASDTGTGRTRDVSAQLNRLRLPLTTPECARMRELGRHVAHAVEAAARHCRRGQTEAEIAGEVAHRLMKRQIVPERIQVAADGQTQRYRHWSYGSDQVERYCVVAAVGRCAGLHAAAGRTVCFGRPPELLRTTHYRTMLMHATGMFFSQANWELREVWKRVARIYEKFGHPDEWRQASQAEIIGYSTCEVPVAPRSEFHLSPQMALHWHPSVGPAMASDTVLVGEHQIEWLTPTERWPRLKITVKGHSVYCPDILCRDDDDRPLDSDDDSVLRIHFDEMPSGDEDSPEAIS